MDGTQEYDTILVEKQGQVDWVSLNRPEALNAINTPMATDLRDYFGSLYENDDTRIVVLRGEGRAFCAGLDIKQAGSGEHAAPFGGGMGFQGYLAEAYIRMRRWTHPASKPRWRSRTATRFCARGGPTLRKGCWHFSRNARRSTSGVER